MNKYISFSGGVESTTMCVLYGKGASALWVDTGAEHDKMYERINYIENKLKALHDGDFQLIRLKGKKKYKGITYHSLIELIKELKVMPSQQMRYCTNYFKVQPIDKYLKDAGECILMIGFNADEEGRTGNMEKLKNVKYSYPLIEDGYTRADCEDILSEHDLHPNFPPYMLRGGCRMCFFKTEKEYKAMYHLNKEEFMTVMEFEESIQDRRKKFYSIMGNEKSLRQLAAECDNEIFDTKILYEDYKKSGRSCGAFCHR